MRRCNTPALLLAALLAGCSDGGTGPTPEELLRGPVALAVTAGQAQSDTIGATLATAITVRLTTAGAGPASPIPGQAISFVVLEPSCGRPFAGSATTNGDGIAAERWELGDAAKSCTMEARAVEPDGTPRVFATVTATVRPGKPVNFGSLSGAIYADSAEIQIRYTDGQPPRGGTLQALRDRRGNVLAWTVGGVTGTAVLREHPMPGNAIRTWLVPTAPGTGTLQLSASDGTLFPMEWRACRDATGIMRVLAVGGPLAWSC